MQLVELPILAPTDLADARRKVHEAIVVLAGDRQLASRKASDFGELARRLSEGGSPMTVRASLLRAGAGRTLELQCRTMDPPPGLRATMSRDGTAWTAAVQCPVSQGWIPQATLDRACEVLRRKTREQLLAENNDLLRKTLQARMESLDRLAREFSSIQDLDTLLSRVLSEAQRTFNCQAGSILMQEDGALRFTHAVNSASSQIERALVAPGSSVHLQIDRSSIAGAAAIDGVIVVADAYRIPHDARYRFNAAIDEATGFRTRAVIAVAMRSSQNELLGVVQLINPRSIDGDAEAEFSEDDRKLAMHFAGLAAMAIERSSMTRALVLRMMRLAELRDPKETGAHVKRVSEVASRLFLAWAERHRLSSDEIYRRLDSLRPAAMLHDVGKVGIPDTILKKPGKLDDAEYAEMRRHTTIGAETLLGVRTALDQAVRDVTLYHHARWDGRGYPSHAEIVRTLETLGLDASDAPEPVGERIPLTARLVAVADVFDALMSRRAYKDAWDPAKVREEIARSGGSHFDPELAELFVRDFDEYCRIHANHAD